MNIIQFIIGVFAVWRITHLFQAEDGPWGIIYKLRKLLGSGFLGSLMDCFYCLSMWMALPVSLLYAKDWKMFLLYWFALSGAAIVVEKISSGTKAYPQEFFIENDDNDQKTN
jgi:Protein of unknown function (DUF1360)